MRRERWRAGLVAVAVLITACGGQAPETLGLLRDGTLPPCPDTPNCVHTGMRHPEGTEPVFLRTESALGEIMSELRRVVEAMPRTTVVTATDNYLHAQARSRLFRFVDDLELLVADDRELIVRSASRLGRSDLGVNGRRLLRLREALGEVELLR